MDTSGRIRDLEQEIRRLKGLEDYQMPVEVTVCMPIGPKKRKWMWQCIESVEPGAQSVPVHFHVTLQPQAQVETASINAGAAELQGKFAKYKMVSLVPDTGNRLRNICRCRETLAASVETPYLLWLDADVKMPVGGVRMLLDAIKADPKIGFLGIPYTFKVDHVQNGCTIMPTELAQKIQWKPERCSCAAAIKQIVELGYTVKHLDGVVAWHMAKEVTS